MVSIAFPNAEGRQIEKMISDLKSKVRTEIAPMESYWINKIEHELWNMHKVQRRTNLEGWHLRLNWQSTRKYL